MPLAGLEHQGWIVAGEAEPYGLAVQALACERGADVMFGEPSRGGTAAIERTASPGQVARYVADLSVEHEVDALFDAAAERLSEINVVVCTFGMCSGQTIPSLVEMSPDDWNRAVTAELRTMFLVSRRALQEYLIGGKGGRLVYIVPPPAGAGGDLIYQTALHALRGLCRTCTKEYGRREITCNVVLPQCDPNGVDRLTAATAETVLWLASERASFVNGETIRVTATSEPLC